MPSDEEVTQRAGRLRAMTGLTEPTFTALLPPFEHALAVYLQDRTILTFPLYAFSLCSRDLPLATP